MRLGEEQGEGERRGSRELLYVHACAHVLYFAFISRACISVFPSLYFYLPPFFSPSRRTYGLMGRIDFYDENRKRIVEVKVSDIDGILPSHEVQSLLYALLYGNGWKPTRAFEIVNLLKGVRYKRVVRKEVKLWECLKRGLEKLEFDEEMVETLGRMYGPHFWEKEREEAAAALLAGKVEDTDEAKNEEIVQAEDKNAEGSEVEEHAALLLVGKSQ